MDAEAPEPVEMDATWRFSIPSSEPLGRPIIAIDDVSFDYNSTKPDGTKKQESEYLLQKVNFGVDNDSKIAILGANGQVSCSSRRLVGQAPAETWTEQRNKMFAASCLCSSLLTFFISPS